MNRDAKHNLVIGDKVGTILDDGRFAVVTITAIHDDYADAVTEDGEPTAIWYAACLTFRPEGVPDDLEAR